MDVKQTLHQLEIIQQWFDTKEKDLYANDKNEFILVGKKDQMGKMTAKERGYAICNLSTLGNKVNALATEAFLKASTRGMEIVQSLANRASQEEPRSRIWREIGEKVSFAAQGLRGVSQKTHAESVAEKQWQTLVRLIQEFDQTVGSDDLARLKQQIDWTTSRHQIKEHIATLIRENIEAFQEGEKLQEAFMYAARSWNP